MSGTSEAPAVAAPRIDFSPPLSSRHIVILGAGFAGLACARELGGANVRVTLVDRRNYHLFVPLLYQVATAGLSPADIAQPVRRLMARHANVAVRLGEACGVDPARRLLRLTDGSALGYDTLVLAPGSSYDYFGHEDWAPLALGPRTLEDAREIRARLLLSFERAEISEEGPAREALLTTIVVGGGPTGVEMAGAIAELARHALARDFRRIDPRSARIVLVEAGPRVLAGFPPNMSAYAQRALEALGVTVLVGQAVEGIDDAGATIGGKLVPAATIVWGAGVKAAPVADWLGVAADRIGRVAVAPDLSVPGLENIYVLGDSAACPGEDGAMLPALAQVADQQGRHLGRALKAQVEEGRAIPPFRFRNRGNTAIVGRQAALFDFGRRQITGRPAWILWAIVHVYLLTGFQKRLLVSVQWLWHYLTYERGARLITRDVELGAVKSVPGPDKQGDEAWPEKM